ncbi:MAG: YdcF family protein [Oscillospiraceae bacterium]|nr:YdcF family protein [Oscillospiraceae bacterium]
MGRRAKQKKHSGSAAKAVLFVLAFLLMTGTIILRYLQNPDRQRPDEVGRLPEASAEAVMPAPTPSQAVSLPAETPRPEEPVNPDSETEAEADEKPVPFQVSVIPEESRINGSEKEYTAETYQLVTDMVYAYRHLGAAGWPQVEEKLSALKMVDPKLGELWDGIMRKWAYVSEELVVDSDSLPDSLPQDNSLCVAVMGYQLLPDGSMAAELLKRCEIGLSLLEKYPHAMLALTGGGTSPLNKEVTEAEVMAEWFQSHGVSGDRMIVENRSMTTGQNAKNTCAILTDQYPQVKEIAVVSSSYHIPQCELLFTEAALLYAYRNGCDIPYTVTGNASFAAVGNEEYSDLSNLGADIWVMADPNY